MNEVLMIVMAAGAVLGGFDRLRGNKWGFGDKFETGFMLLGSMALSMVGVNLLALLAQADSFPTAHGGEHHLAVLVGEGALAVHHRGAVV